MKYEETQYGFIYGPVDIQRMCSDEKEGWVAIGANTAKSRVQIYVTKTGKVRIWKDNVEMCAPLALKATPKKRKAKKGGGAGDGEMLTILMCAALAGLLLAALAGIAQGK